MKITHAHNHGGLAATLYVQMTYREFAYLKTLAGSVSLGGEHSGTAQKVYQDMATIPWGYIQEGVCPVIALKPGHQDLLNEFAQP